MVVGVSSSQGNLGQEIVKNLMTFNFRGVVHLVGRSGGSFLGHVIHKDIASVPGPVDFAVLLVPAALVPGMLRDCARKGVRRVVVESGGFSELDASRSGLEEEVRSILMENGMRMIGPNCLGIVNTHAGLALPFVPFVPGKAPGFVSVISQSGGIASRMYEELVGEGIGISKFVSVGNKLDVNELDLIEYLAGDDETRIIYCYLEGITDGRALMELALKTPKPIIIHKANRGSKGARIAHSHSASLTSDDAVVDAALRQCGIVRVRNEKQGVAFIKAFSLPRMKGNRLLLVSRSGGHAVIGADAAEEFGFDLPPLPDELRVIASAASRSGVISFDNPLDLGDVFDLETYRALAETGSVHLAFDGLIFVHHQHSSLQREETRGFAEALSKLNAEGAKPVVGCLFSNFMELDWIRKNANPLIFQDVREAVEALAASRDSGKDVWSQARNEKPAGIDMDAARAELDALPDGAVPAASLARILEAYGIPLVPWGFGAGEEEVVQAAERIGYPVVLKTAAPSVVHKTEAGGVRIGIADEEALRQAYRDISRLGPEALVEKMLPGEAEWIIGGRWDDLFGPVVISGPGGILVEVMKETGIRVAPLGRPDAERLVDGSKGAALLRGVRGKPALDRAAVIDLLVRLSWLLFDLSAIRELDLNPVAVRVDGCAALDWRAFKDSSTLRR